MHTVAHMGGHTHINIKEACNYYVSIKTEVRELGVVIPWMTV